MTALAPVQTKMESHASTNDLPELVIDVLHDPQAKRDALKLVVDSVAQQRQTASRILIFHPYCLALLVAAGSVAAYFVRDKDLGVLLLSGGSLIIIYLSTIRYLTSPYISKAEDTDWEKWLHGPDDVDDSIIGAKYGSEIIGALVLQLDQTSPRNKKTTKAGHATIRAWTTRLRYRNKGLGADLLLKAVEIAKQKLGQDTVVAFADDHANAARILHRAFNKEFDSQERRAQQTLSHAIERWERGEGKML